MSEQRPGETTRIVLRSFGVMVTTFEEKMAALLEQATKDSLSPEEALQLLSEALALVARLTHRLREVNELVLSGQERSLSELHERLLRRFPSLGTPPES